ncbi:MAG: sigma-70 family RNA polymerase sigma factor [bacterium]
MVHMDSLYNTALRMTRNELDAEDLLQDVCIRAYRFFDKFKKDTNFKAWIFKILTNTYINQYRKKLSLPHQVELEKVKHVYIEDKRDVHNHVIENFRQLEYESLFDDEIRTALEQLPDEFRMVVLLADIENFSYKQIAKIIGCPLGTVMSRLSRGRKQLQIHLKDYALRGGFISRAN